ncbi:MAG TPA: SH3 domain-containing protein, partial [Methyloceanibacter sp.]
MLSQSDIIVRHGSLTERLAAAAPPQAEPTPTTMAERFAPEAQKNSGGGDGPARLPADSPVVMPGIVPPRVRAGSSNRGLLVASMLVSLVPTAIILVLMWQGAIRMPGSDRAAPTVFDHEQFLESQQASVAVAPAMLIQPPAEAPKADVALTAPARLVAKTGEELAFDITIDSADALPARSVIAIRAIPEGVTFSQGRPYGASEWNLTPDEIGDLKLRLPKARTGSTDLRVELMEADGTILASASTRLDVAQDPKSTLILRADESDRVEDLIAHGQKMIDVGYFAGARAYFRRAAEAGSGEAALMLAATYDQESIDKIGAHGIKADPDQARIWYERAKQLGVEGADVKLAALKRAWAEHQPAPALAPPQPAAAAEPSQPSEPTQLAGAEPNEASDVAPDDDGEVTVSGIGVVPVPSTSLPMPPTGGDAWVALVGYANVRVAPSSNAESIKIAEKGTKFRATGRKGNWVQVTDPDTAEVGWVYSRYVEATP